MGIHRKKRDIRAQRDLSEGLKEWDARADGYPDDSGWAMRAEWNASRLWVRLRLRWARGRMLAWGSFIRHGRRQP